MHVESGGLNGLRRVLAECACRDRHTKGQSGARHSLCETPGAPSRTDTHQALSGRVGRVMACTLTRPPERSGSGAAASVQRRRQPACALDVFVVAPRAAVCVRAGLLISVGASWRLRRPAPGGTRRDRVHETRCFFFGSPTRAELSRRLHTIKTFSRSISLFNQLFHLQSACSMT